MTTQTRRRWNIKSIRPSLRVQADNPPRIVIRYTSRRVCFLSSFTSSLIGVRVFGYGHQLCELIISDMLLLAIFFFRISINGYIIISLFLNSFQKYLKQNN